MPTKYGFETPEEKEKRCQKETQEILASHAKDRDTKYQKQKSLHEECIEIINHSDFNYSLLNDIIIDYCASLDFEITEQEKSDYNKGNYTEDIADRRLYQCRYITANWKWISKSSTQSREKHTWIKAKFLASFSDDRNIIERITGQSFDTEPFEFNERMIKVPHIYRLEFLDGYNYDLGQQIENILKIPTIYTISRGPSYPD